MLDNNLPSLKIIIWNDNCLIFTYRVNLRMSSRKYSATGNTTFGMVNIGALSANSTKEKRKSEREDGGERERMRERKREAGVWSRKAGKGKRKGG